MLMSRPSQYESMNDDDDDCFNRNCKVRDGGSTW